jgi:FkbM family methyltransferase
MQTINSDFTSEFGAYALSPAREFFRRMARWMPASKPGMWGASTFRRISLLGHPHGLAGPHDIAVAENVSARLYPASNRCEKRAFAGVQTWDPEERGALVEALGEATDTPFIFFDVGANVGLYSLFLSAAARKLGKALQIIAIEPDPENRARLEFNSAASGAKLLIEPVAISSEAGQGTLGGGEVNRGSIRLTDTVEIGGVEVTLETLASVVARHGLARIDAMKVDIEGHDLMALTAFFGQAPKNVFPKLLIVEVGKVENSPIIDLALEQGYEMVQRTKINAVMRRRDK